ncbi:hypothetical protein CsSME_00012893 [Camellia sinensis var. sinensis]
MNFYFKVFQLFHSTIVEVLHCFSCSYVPMFGETEFDPIQQFHSIDIEEQLDALGRAVDAGKVTGTIKGFAASNLSNFFAEILIVSGLNAVIMRVLWYSTPPVLHQLEKSNCYIHGASLFESFAEDFGKDAMMEDWVKKFEKLAGSQEHFNNLIWS